jgi:hypothetical protein
LVVIQPLCQIVKNNNAIKDMAYAICRNCGAEHTRASNACSPKCAGALDRIRRRLGVALRVVTVVERGPTLEQLEAIHSESCAICGHEPAPGAKGAQKLHIDHDPKTGKLRGLLCMGCNVALGHFEDDVERIKRAIAYLEASRG